MRPMLRPGMSWAWRSPTSLQLGVDDPASVVLTGLPPQCAAALALMDGTRTTQAISAAMAPDGEVSDVESLIDRLVAVGAVVDGGRWPGGCEVSSDARARLLPDLMAGAPADPDEWWATLA